MLLGLFKAGACLYLLLLQISEGRSRGGGGKAIAMSSSQDSLRRTVLTVAPAVATGSGNPPDWAHHTPSNLQHQLADQSGRSALIPKERDFSLGFNGGTTSSAAFDHRPGVAGSGAEIIAAGAAAHPSSVSWSTDPPRPVPANWPARYIFPFEPSSSDPLPLSAPSSSLNVLAGQPLFHSPSRLFGVVNTEIDYARGLSNTSRAAAAGGNEDHFSSFYGQRLPQRRDHDDAIRAGVVSFVDRDVQQGEDRGEATEAGASSSIPVSSSSELQPLVLRRLGSVDQEAPQVKSGGVSIVSHSAEGQQWPANILIRANPSDNEQQQRIRSAHDNEQRVEGRGEDVTSVGAGLGVAVDMELLGSVRGTMEEQQQQQQQQQHHHQQHHQQQQQQMFQLQQHKPMQAEPILLRQRSSSGNSIACQDCGNQAKKDCVHSRCRTCCKSRGYECPTHIRSTWVPAAKRRERQQAELAAMIAGQPVPKSKRARTLLAGAAHQLVHGAAPSYNTSTSTGTPPRASDFGPSLLPISHQQESLLRSGALPPEIRTQALFQCVRVTGCTDGRDEYAYRTVVRIGGRIFKGLLHDQGVSDIRGPVPSSGIGELQLGGRSVAMTSALIDLAGIYGAPGNTLLGGSKESMPGPF